MDDVEAKTTSSWSEYRIYLLKSLEGLEKLIKDLELRLDAVRQTDREDAKSQATAAARTAETLRDQVATTAKAQQDKVDAVAKALHDQFGAFTDAVNKRLLALELSVSALINKGEGGKQMWGWIVGGIAVLIAVAKFLMERK